MAEVAQAFRAEIGAGVQVAIEARNVARRDLEADAASGRKTMLVGASEISIATGFGCDRPADSSASSRRRVVDDRRPTPA
jgi:hypothetical protein